MAVPNGVTHTASYVAPTSPHSTENVVGVFPTKPPDIAGNDTALQKVPVHNGPHENSIHVAETKASEMAVTTAATPLGVDSTSGKTTATTSGSSMRATSFQTPGLDPVVSKSSTTSSELLALSPVQKPSDRITPPMKAQLKGEIRTYDSNTTTKLFLQSTAKGTRHGPSGGILNPPVHKVSDNEKPPVTTTTTFITTTTTTTTRATRLPPPPDVTRLSRSSSYVTQPPTNSSTAASGRSIPGPSPMNPAGDGKPSQYAPNSIGSSPSDSLALVVLPIALAVLILLGVLAIIFLVKKRRKKTGYRRTDGDEETSSNMEGFLISGSEARERIETTVVAEPLYAKVDRSKKRCASEILTAEDETVPLKDYALTANGNCPVAALAELQESAPLYADSVEDDDVFTKKRDVGTHPIDINELPASKVLALSHEGEPAIGEGLRSSSMAEAGLTIVECDIYGIVSTIDYADDEDDTYEIPESPSVVQARLSQVGLLSKNPTLPPRPSRPGRTSMELPIPQRLKGDASDSDSDADTDFEDWTIGALSEGAVKGKVQSPPVPPPIPSELPDSGTDSDAYLAPECHSHEAPGPSWKPFHEYDPVYVPHSDPVAMDKRVDNQNYVRGRPRSDSRSTNPYEEIAFNGIYATVDDEDITDEDSVEDEVGSNCERKTPSPPPPPLVPRRRNRPISGVADMGRPRLSLRKAAELPEKHEPRYSGLIKEDVESEDEEPHEYTPLTYTKLMSQGEGPLLSEDDVKLIDADTDNDISDTYKKYKSSNGILKSGKDLYDLSGVNGIMNGAEGTEHNAPDDVGEGDRLFQKYADDVSVLYNGGQVRDTVDESSSGSDDSSYEPFDFSPPQTANK